MSAPQEPAPKLGVEQLAVATSVLLVAVAASWYLELHLASKIVLAATRATLQLAFLGYCLLVPLFHTASPTALLAYVLFMLTVAALEASGRSAHRYTKIFRDSFVAMGGALALVLSFALALVVKPTPFWDPHVALPIAGMLLGNCITAFSLSLDRLLAELAEEGSPVVEMRLAFGATAQEAARPAVTAAAKAGMTPSLNLMSVVGIVSIPGMMTGQILGGQSPEDAAKYQLMIIFLICATGTLAVVGGQYLVLRELFDSRHRLRAERISKRAGEKKDVLTKVVTGLWEMAKYHVSKRKGTLEYSALSTSEDVELPMTMDVECKGELEENKNNEESAVAVGSYVVEGLERGSEVRECIEIARTGETAHGEKCALRVFGLPVGLNRGSKRALLVENVTTGLRRGEVLCITGESGIGKSRLLRQISALDPPYYGEDIDSEEFETGNKKPGVTLIQGLRVRLGPTGEVRYGARLRDRAPSDEVIDERDSDGRPAGSSPVLEGCAQGKISSYGTRIEDLSAPNWRSGAIYVAQDVPSMSGTPRMLLSEFCSFKSQRRNQRRKLDHGEQESLAGELGLDQELLNMPWTRLSGGQRQRCLLWIALVLQPNLILLDEPTSALDAQATQLVERVLVKSGMATVWITHDEAQVKRVANFHLHMHRDAAKRPASDEDVHSLTAVL